MQTEEEEAEEEDADKEEEETEEKAEEAEEEAEEEECVCPWETFGSSNNRRHFANCLYVYNMASHLYETQWWNFTGVALRSKWGQSGRPLVFIYQIKTFSLTLE